MLRLVAFLNVVALATCSAPQRDNFLSTRISKLEASDRLSPEVLPMVYTLQIRLEEDFVNTRTFSGSVSITLNVTANVSDFQFHAKDLIFTETSLKKGSVVQESTFSDIDPETDLVKVTPTEKLEAGTYTLAISYTGLLSNTSMVGFYLSSYVDPFKKTKYVAATQFEDVHARKAFPCFDEPELKATFGLTVVFPKEYHVWSNMNGADPKDDSTNKNLDSVRFLATKQMSTYLVAFVVAEFNCKNGGLYNDRVTIQLCSRISAFDHSAKVALDTAPQILQIMSDYTQHNYSEIIKLTLGAIPDFAPGAMENWGLVTFRESELFWDENESSNYYKQTVVTVVAHELSHQWFGDLVTLNWWSDVFLNEGFATYFEYHAPDTLYPEWQLPKQFVIEQLQPALESDSLGTALPLSLDDVNSDYSGRTNDVSYNKGGSILRMVQHFLGIDNFKLGLVDYIQNNAFSTVSPEILWDSLDAHKENLAVPLPENLRTVMENWVKKPGYPILNVNSSGADIIISQEQFVVSGDADDTQWYVPITYTASVDNSKFTETATQQWLSPGKNLTLTGVLADSKWVVLNNQQVGFYRVNYDASLLKIISDTLNSNIGDIDEISRAQIVDDLFNLARAGKKTYNEIFTFLSFLKNEESYYTWSTVFNNFDNILKRIASQDTVNAVNAFLKQQMEQLLKSAPIEQVIRDDHLYTLKQSLALSWACRLRDDKCLADSRQGFVDLQSNNSVNPDLKSVVYCNGLRTSTSIIGESRFLWQKYEATQLATERVTILKTMGCANDAYTREHYLSMILTDDIRQQDLGYVFSSVYANNPEGPTEVLHFIIDNYKEITELFGGTSPVNSALSSVASYVTTQAQIDALQKFSETKDLDESIANSATGAIATAKANLEIAEKLEQDLKVYFKLKSSDSVNNSPFVNVIFILAGLLLVST